jgi:hypothetical protein
VSPQIVLYSQQPLAPIAASAEEAEEGAAGQGEAQAELALLLEAGGREGVVAGLEAFLSSGRWEGAREGGAEAAALPAATEHPSPAPVAPGGDDAGRVWRSLPSVISWVS